MHEPKKIGNIDSIKQVVFCMATGERKTTSTPSKENIFVFFIIILDKIKNEAVYNTMLKRPTYINISLKFNSPNILNTPTKKYP